LLIAETATPIVPDEERASDRATEFGVYPVILIAASTAATVRGFTARVRFRTCDTVAVETAAFFATSTIVTDRLIVTLRFMLPL
jgi:hypothetical protein